MNSPHKRAPLVYDPPPPWTIGPYVDAATDVAIRAQDQDLGLIRDEIRRIPVDVLAELIITLGWMVDVDRPVKRAAA